MTDDAALASRRLERKCAALSAKPYLPPGLVRLVEATAKLLAEARASAQVPGVPAALLPTADRHLAGVPLVERQAFGYDPAQARELFDRLLAVVIQAGAPLEEPGRAVAAALAQGELDPAEAFAAHLAQDEAFFTSFAARTPTAPRLLSFLAAASLSPGLEAFAAHLAAHHPDNVTWPHGHCPICGSQPLIASLREKEGQRHLTCSFCHTDYRAKRLQCPFCLEESPDKLQFFEVKEEPGYQVHVCATCRNYLKTVDFRQLDRASVPLLDDLESLALDVLAQEQGYTRPTLSAWGF